jgi:hypothetical protein
MELTIELPFDFVQEAFYTLIERLRRCLSNPTHSLEQIHTLAERSRSPNFVR